MAHMEQAGRSAAVKVCIAVAGLNGFMAVALGAVGAHAVAEPALATLVERASLYQLIHAGVLLAIAGQTGRIAALAKLAILIGIILFCGSLYGKALLGWPSTLAPAGGIALMLGWLLIAISGAKRL